MYTEKKYQDLQLVLRRWNLPGVATKFVWLLPRKDLWITVVISPPGQPRLTLPQCCSLEEQWTPFFLCLACSPFPSEETLNEPCVGPLVQAEGGPDPKDLRRLRPMEDQRGHRFFRSNYICCRSIPRHDMCANRPDLWLLAAIIRHMKFIVRQWKPTKTGGFLIQQCLDRWQNSVWNNRATGCVRSRQLDTNSYSRHWSHVEDK